MDSYIRPLSDNCTDIIKNNNHHTNITLITKKKTKAKTKKTSSHVLGLFILQYMRYTTLRGQKITIEDSTVSLRSFEVQTRTVSEDEPLCLA